jgi:hypothetical protein
VPIRPVSGTPIRQVQPEDADGWDSNAHAPVKAPDWVLIQSRQRVW